MGHDMDHLISLEFLSQQIGAVLKMGNPHSLAGVAALGRMEDEGNF